MNKYQEALDYVNKSVCTALSCLGVNDTKTKESLHTLQELVDKEKSPTLEEVKKEWEELGYEWFEVENNSKEISFRSQKLNTDIYIDKVSKDVQICVCHYNYAQTISFELHKLIHKTFKALGWL